MNEGRDAMKAHPIYLPPVLDINIMTAVAIRQKADQKLVVLAMWTLFNSCTEKRDGKTNDAADKARHINGWELESR